MTDLTPRQQRALDTSLDVSVAAGAGTGKTRVLVERYVRALDQDPTLSPGSILALTFTEKAAAEMRERVRKELRARADRHGGRWEPMLAELEVADISTIHSFCMRLLRDEPVAMGYDPDMGVLTEMGLEELLTEVLSSLFTTDGEVSASVRRLLRDMGNDSLDRTIRKLLKERGRLFKEENYGPLKDRSRENMTKFHREAVAKAMEGFNILLPDLKALALARCPKADDRITKAIEGLRPVLDGIRARKDPPDDHWAQHLMDRLYRVRDQMLTKAGAPRAFSLGGSSKVWGNELVKVRKALLNAATFVHENLTVLAFMDGGDMLSRALERHDDLFFVMSHVERILSERKREINLVDFDDQINMALRMLVNNTSGVKNRLEQRYRHIMVDEFQDTDPRQWLMVSLLWDGMGQSRLFVVGDPKQSIYGFRSADVRLFNRAREAVRSGPNGRDVVLDRNFRSRKELVDLVNSLFPRLFSLDGGPGEWGVNYDPLEPERGTGGTVTLVGVKGKMGAEAREGAFAAELIKGAVGRTTVVEDGKERPLRYSDVAILLPNRIGSRYYEDALRAALIPYQTGKGKGLFDRQEVRDVNQLLTYLLNPNDEVALLSVLKGPFFSLGDEELVRVSMSRGQSLVVRLRRAGHEKAVDLLDECRCIVQEQPPVRAIGSVLEKVGAFALSGGRRSHRNLDRLLEWAAAQRTDESIHDLVRTLRSAVENPPMEGEPPFSPESDAVPVMTVHAAKGLEWPFVIVLGLHHGHRRESGSCVLEPGYGLGVKVMDDREGEFVPTPAYDRYRKELEEKAVQERRRVLYVACTRAKDHLVLSGVCAGGQDGDEDPNSCMADLMEALDMDGAAFEREHLDVGGTDVRIVQLAPDDVRSLSEDDVGPPALSPRLSDKDPFRFLGAVPPAEDGTLLNPTSRKVLDAMISELGLEIEEGTGSAGGKRSLSAPTPRKMGDMVHTMMMGAPSSRVAFELGHPDLGSEIELRAKTLREKVRALSPVREWKELEVCTTIEVKGLGRVRLMGRMDLVLQLKDGSYLIIDFKTGRARSEYEAQLEVYKRMLERMVDAPVKVMVMTDR